MPFRRHLPRKAVEHRSVYLRGCSLAAGMMRFSRFRMRMYTSIYGSMFVLELSQFLYSAGCLAILFSCGWSLPTAENTLS